jgi:RNA recognition motif-containing protein
MTEEDGIRFKLSFEQKKIDTFAGMREEVHQEALFKEKLKAQRAPATEVHQNTSAFKMQPTTEDLESRILKIVQQALATVKGSENFPGKKVFVGSINPVASEEQVKSAMQQFGPVLSVKILRKPDGSSKRCGFVEFKDAFAAKAAICKSKQISVLGSLIVIEAAVEKKTGSINSATGSYSTGPKVNSENILNGCVDSGCTPHHLYLMQLVLKISPPLFLLTLQLLMEVA